MNLTQFLIRHNASPGQICAEDCLQALMEDLDLGLKGQGNLPMLPSYLSTDIPIPAGAQCCVLDAGGTNLRTARAVYAEKGTWHLEDLQKCPMPGTEGPLSFQEFYGQLAAPVKQLDACQRVGFCFSYNVTLDQTLDGTLDFWCKEVQVPDAVGMPVGASLKNAVGEKCEAVHVLNDSVAAMLGGGGEQPVQVGIILGTGINVCYSEQCRNIEKLPCPLHSDTMIISTEVGEFNKVPKSDFDLAVIAVSDAPDSAHAEKQCSGGYLGSTICQAWRCAAEEGVLPESFRPADYSLADISQHLSGGTDFCPDAVAIAKALIHRAAKVAAILCAGPMLRCAKPGQILRMAVEGSQYWKLAGFREGFHQELDTLVAPYGIRYEIVQTENACLIGAAKAAFARPM